MLIGDDGDHGPAALYGAIVEGAVIARLVRTKQPTPKTLMLRSAGRTALRVGSLVFGIVPDGAGRHTRGLKLANGRFRVGGRIKDSDDCFAHFLASSFGKCNSLVSPGLVVSMSGNVLVPRHHRPLLVPRSPTSSSLVALSAPALQ